MQNHVVLVRSKQFGLVKNDLVDSKSIVLTIRITRPYLVWERLEIKEKYFFQFQMAKKNPTSEKTGWFLLLGQFVPCLVKTKQIENATFLQYRLGD